MSGLISQGNKGGLFSTELMTPTHKSFISKLVDSRALFEAFPTSKTWGVLEPEIRKIAHFSKDGILTQGANLLSIFEKRAKVVYETGDGFEHKLYIDNNDLRATVMKIEHSPTDLLGRGRKTFFMWLDVEWYGDRSVLLLDGQQNAPLLIRDMSLETNGSRWYKYELALMSGNPNEWIEGSEVKVGDKVTQIAALRGEGAIQRDSVAIGQDDAYIKFFTPSTSFGWNSKVTDQAWYNMKHFGMTTTNKKLIGILGDKMITPNIMEFEFKKRTDMHIDYWLTYGRATSKFAPPFLDSVTNRPLKAGPGFHEWMKAASRGRYSPNENVIEYMSDLMQRKWHNNVDIDRRIVDWGTGTLGLRFFTRSAKELGLPHIIEDQSLNYERSGGGFDGKHNGIMINKKQITGTFLDPFGQMRVHYIPHFDDDKFEKRKYKGLSINSGRFLALDYGLGSGDQSNIYIIKDPLQGGFVYGLGLHSPWGSVTKNPSLANRAPNTLNSENAYELIRDEKVTLVVKDPGAILMLEMAVK